eukprot:s735_g6.t1
MLAWLQVSAVRVLGLDLKQYRFHSEHGELLLPFPGSEAFVRLRNLAEQIPEHAGSALRRRGVAVLRPGLSADDVVGQDFLRRELQREEMTSAMSRLLRPDSQLFLRLGFGRTWCGEVQIRQAPPRKSGQEPSPPFMPLSGPLNVPSVWLQPLRYIPWLARLLKGTVVRKSPP